MHVYLQFTNLSQRIPDSFIAFVARLAAAVPFWRSGQSKIDGSEILGIKWNILSIKENKFYLFQDHYGFPEAIAPAAAHLAAFGEFFLPLMLVFGIGARFGALGLIVMTAVIQFYVFPGDLLKMNGNWSLHLLWFAPLLYVLAKGPGSWSIDALLARRYEGKTASEDIVLGKAHS